MGEKRWVNKREIAKWASDNCGNCHGIEAFSEELVRRRINHSVLADIEGPHVVGVGPPTLETSRAIERDNAHHDIDGGRYRRKR